MSRSLSAFSFFLCGLLAAACVGDKGSGDDATTGAGFISGGEGDTAGEADTGGQDSAGADGAGPTPSIADLCADYIAAMTECYNEAGLDVSTLGFTDAYCDAYSDPIYGAYFECYIEVLSGSDCSTREGLAAVSTALASCLPG